MINVHRQTCSWNHRMNHRNISLSGCVHTKKMWQILHDYPLYWASIRGMIFTKLDVQMNWSEKLATETALFASDSVKDPGTYSLGGAISVNHLMYKPEKTCLKDWESKFFAAVQIVSIYSWKILSNHALTVIWGLDLPQYLNVLKVGLLHPY